MVDEALTASSGPPALPAAIASRESGTGSRGQDPAPYSPMGIYYPRLRVMADDLRHGGE